MNLGVRGLEKIHKEQCKRQRSSGNKYLGQPGDKAAVLGLTYNRIFFPEEFV